MNISKEDLTLEEAKAVTLTSSQKEDQIIKTRLALEQPIQQESDLTGVMKNLNEDKVDAGTKMSSIDMKTRLQPVELSSIIVHDVVIALNCLPEICLVTTRKKKRLAVSLMGEGRREMVDLVRGERDRTSQGGIMGKIKSLFVPPDKT